MSVALFAVLMAASAIVPGALAASGGLGSGHDPIPGGTADDGALAQRLPFELNGGFDPNADVTITLYGDTMMGWGLSPGGETIPGPDLTVDHGDSVTMNLHSEDGLPHRFHVDYDGDGQVDAGEPASDFFTSFTTFTFTANVAGTFAYRCTVHPSSMFGTWVTNPPPPVHDVAVTSVAPDRTDVAQGDTVHIAVGVKNEGNVQESTDVTAFAGASSVGTQSVTLTAGETQTLTFSWDTTGFPTGTYTISANAAAVPGETDTADNTLVDGTVTVNPSSGGLAASLSGRSAWPGRHHFSITRSGTMQDLFGKVANVGSGPVNALVRFTIQDEAGATVAVVDSNSIVIPVGESRTVSGSWTVQVGRFHVTAQCWFDSDNDGTFDGSDPDTKSFSFAVVP